MRIVNDGGIQTDGQKLFARKASAAFTTFQQILPERFAIRRFRKMAGVADNRDRFAVRVVLNDRCINGICCWRRREAQVIHNRSHFLRFIKSMERHAFAMAFRGKSVCFALYPPLTTANRARAFGFLHRGDTGQISGQGCRRRVGKEVK
ncbi:hypothetical protein ExPUPEC129_00569 [Escherichia coli]|nr:hypothetical protein ExPCM15_00329 [Escherichia coli]GCM63582.1 hypothetical protein ExPCM17_01367 [Escherichia coli]GCN11310.1 hypothetical protein ExPCM18_02504 [Escherichia coli]GCY76135.1 hypothetical protein HmCmsJML096_02073 [Escherichia coli]GDE04532.1 hypothetical protein HmCmsJML288_03273 [Escherichia coli]